jgi:hypothetical protein
MYVFAKLVTGESVIGIKKDEDISHVVRLNFLNDEAGKPITHLSAYLPFEPQILPIIDSSKLMCSMVPIVEENNVDLLNVYSNIVNNSNILKNKFVN